MTRVGISYQILNKRHKADLELCHCVDVEKGSGIGQADAAHSISYPPDVVVGQEGPVSNHIPSNPVTNNATLSLRRAPRETPASNLPKRRKKRGRPCKPWHQRSAYQRRFCEKRLRPHEVENLILADGFAARTGRRLETFITIRWQLTGMGEADIHGRWLSLLNALRIWCSRHGLELAHVWVHENPPRHQPSFNTHLLANIPPVLRGRLTRWLIARLDALDGAIRVEPRTHADWRRPDARLMYMLKGTDKATAIRHRLIGENGWDWNQGLIPFKRSGTSANINGKARNGDIRELYAPAREGEGGSPARFAEQYAHNTRARGKAA